MSAPTWSVGQVLTSSDVNTWFVDIVRGKPTDEGPITTATLQNDNDLQLPLAANAEYELEGYLYATGAALASADLKIGLTVPAGTTYHYTAWGYDVAVTLTPLVSPARSSGTVSLGVNGGAASPVMIKGQVTTSSTSGTLVLQWAENTGNASGTSVLAKSWLKARRIG